MGADLQGGLDASLDVMVLLLRHGAPADGAAEGVGSPPAGRPLVTGDFCHLPGLRQASVRQGDGLHTHHAGSIGIQPVNFISRLF